MAWKKVGAVLRNKKGSGNYIQIQLKDKDGNGPDTVTLKHGQSLQLFDPRKSKFMTEERLAKLPDYVRMEVFIAPEGNENKS